MLTETCSSAGARRARPLSGRDPTQTLRSLKNSLCEINDVADVALAGTARLIDALSAHDHRCASAAIQIVGDLAALLDKNLLKLLQGHALIAPSVAASVGDDDDIVIRIDLTDGGARLADGMNLWLKTQ